MDLFFGNRVDQAKFAGMKMYAAVLITSVEAVFQIPFYGAAYGSELGADLVMPARMKVDLQQVQGIQFFEKLVLKDRPFAFGNFF